MTAFLATSFFKFIYLFIFAVLGLRFCVRAFCSCGERGPLFIAVRGPLTVAASLVAEHRLQTRRLSSCGSRAQLLRGMRDLPRPGLEPVSPALAGRLSTTAPPGKPLSYFFCISLAHIRPSVYHTSLSLPGPALLLRSYLFRVFNPSFHNGINFLPTTMGVGVCSD